MELQTNINRSYGLLIIRKVSISRNKVIIEAHKYWKGFPSKNCWMVSCHGIDCWCICLTIFRVNRVFNYIVVLQGLTFHHSYYDSRYSYYTISKQAP